MRAKLSRTVGIEESSALASARGVRAGGIEEVLGFVVVAVGRQGAGSPAQVDGARAEVEPLSRLRRGEQPGLTQAVVPALQAVGSADLADEVPVEPQAPSGSEPPAVEQVRNLPFGVAVEEAVDLGDDLARGRPEFGGRGGSGQGERGRRPASEADPGGDGLVLEEGDVVEEEADDPFSVSVRGARGAPEPGEVGGQGEDAGPLLWTRLHPVGLALALGVFLGLVKVAKPGVPFALEDVGHQAVVGVDAQVAGLGEVGFVAGALDVLGSEPIHRFGLLGEFLLDLEGHVERQGGDPLDEEFADGLVDGGSGNPLAGRPGVLDRVALADVVRGEPASARVVGHGHAPAAAAADGQALQERGPFAGRAGPAVGAVGLSALGEAPLVVLVGGPGDVALVGSGEEGVPWVPGEPRERAAASGSRAPSAMRARMAAISPRPVPGETPPLRDALARLGSADGSRPAQARIQAATPRLLNRVSPRPQGPSRPATACRRRSS